MREFRLKQKRLKKFMNAIVISTAVFMFLYIGAEPILAKSFGTGVTIAINYIGDALIVACLVILFVYYSKYGKCDKTLRAVEYELSDNGYYLYGRDQTTTDDYCRAVHSELLSKGYNIDENVEIDGFDFNVRALKKKEFFYIICDESVDSNDIIAYQQSVIYDITSVNIRRKGDAVILFICDKAEESAIALSKMIVPLGKKEEIHIANAIIELSTGRCYFLGNDPSKCQQMIVEYAMGCELPLDDKYIVDVKLDFQSELEEHMKDFNIKDFKNGTFYVH